VAWYFDTSALVKLVVREPGSAALRQWINGTHRDATTSDLARTELVRAVRRVDASWDATARNVLDAITIVQLRADVFIRAARLEPADLRSLDAIHLAAALDLGDDLEGMITYDERLAAAAGANGVTVVAPA